MGRSTGDLKKDCQAIFDEAGACPSTEDLSAYLTGGLTPETEPLVGLHVMNCPICFSLVERLDVESDDLATGERLSLLNSVDEIGERLGFQKKRTPGAIRTWLENIRSIRTPLMVPASLAAALVIMTVLFAVDVGERPAAVEYFGNPRIVSFQELDRPREAGGEATEMTVTAGEPIAIMDYLPQDRVLLQVLGPDGAVQLSATIETINKRVMAPLRLSRPGEYRVLFFEEGAESPLREYRLTVVAPEPEPSS